jgi:molybdenum ABC transporter molybdate-binding protein
VFWSADPKLVDKDGKAVKEMKFNKCAVADPKLAPYGEAAYETLKSLKLLDKYQPKFVTGNNIGKTFQFVKTGNAEVGFVAQERQDHGRLRLDCSVQVLSADPSGRGAPEARRKECRCQELPQVPAVR